MTPSALKRPVRVCAIAFATLIIPGPVRAAAEDVQPRPTMVTRAKGAWSVSSGISYSLGDYGEAYATRVISIPVSLKYRRGPWRFKLSMPWVHISGPGSLIQVPEGRESGPPAASTNGNGSSNAGSGTSGSADRGSGNSIAGGSTPGGAATTNVRLLNQRSGGGDLSISATYSAALGRRFYADVTGKVKFPTASRAKRVGTGRVDVTTALDLIKDEGPASFYVSGRRKFAGKSLGSQIRSVWGAGGGASIRASRIIIVGADYDWQQASFMGGRISSEVTGWTYLRLSKLTGLTVYGGAGLNRSSAAFLGGATVTVRL